MQTETSSPEAGMEEESMPILNKKSDSDDVMNHMRRLQATTVPLDAVKLGKRRRSENECIEDQWQNLINDQTDEEAATNLEHSCLSKRQKINLAGDKW